MSHHRATIITPETWIKPWKYLWRNKRKHVKNAIVKCEVCFPTGKTNKRTKQFRDRKYHNPRQDYRDARYERATDLAEDREWKIREEEELAQYYDDLYEPWEWTSKCPRHSHQTISLYDDCPICDREAEMMSGSTNNFSRT